MTAPSARALTGPCGELHDPEPYIQSGMAASAQAMWWGKSRFKPRAPYCQDQDCYDKAKEARERNTGRG